MCLQDLRIAQRLKPRLVTVVTVDEDWTAIPDFSRCYMIHVASQTGENKLVQRFEGPLFLPLPQRLDMGSQVTAISPTYVSPVYGREVLAGVPAGLIGVSDPLAEGQTRLIYWEMDAETMHEVFGPLS